MSLIGSISLHRIPAIEDVVKEKLARCDLRTVQDLFSLTELDLMERADLHMSEAVRLQSIVARHAIRSPPTAFDILQRGGLGQFRMDDGAAATAIHPGITELVGPPGLGKTQWCFTLCAKAYLPLDEGGLGGGTFWIDTEGAYSNDRLIAIAQTGFPHFYLNQRDRIKGLTAKTQVLQLVGAADKPHQLLKKLEQLEPVLLQGEYKLLVLDGIAAAFRAHDPSGRADLLGAIASQLKLLSETLNIAIIVTNQVTTRFVAPNASVQPEANAGPRFESQLVAALGVGWAHAVNTRFVLETTDAAERRVLRVAKSPRFAFQTIPYAITEAGCRVVQMPANSTGSASAPTAGSASAVSVHNMPLQNALHMPIGTRIVP